MPSGVYKHKPNTEEQNRKIGEASKGRKCPKVSEMMKGNKYNLGRKQSPETIAKRFAWMKDYIVSEETKEKMRLAQKGHIGQKH
jgi:hypothetical protein